MFDAVRGEKELVALTSGAHAPLEPGLAELCSAVESWMQRHESRRLTSQALLTPLSILVSLGSREAQHVDATCTLRSQ